MTVDHHPSHDDDCRSDCDGHGYGGCVGRVGLDGDDVNGEKILVRHWLD